jgi:hypothetical protein
VVALEQLEDRRQRGREVERARERLADLDERGELADLAGARAVAVAVRVAPTPGYSFVTHG